LNVPFDIPARARAAGFSRAGFVDPAALAGRTGLFEGLLSRGWYEKRELSGMELDWVIHPDAWAKSSSILVCALSYFRPEPDDLSAPGDPHALIAPFARRDYYRAAVRMLRGLLAEVEAALGIPRRSARIFSNSRIPEKPMVVAAGQGSLGANGLAMIPGLGTAFTISGAILPIPSAAGTRAEPPGDDPCACCDLCARACPVNAIVAPGLVDPDLCLQGFAARRDFPKDRWKTWGVRLYGCQICQDVCPHNRGIAEESPVSDGEIGPSVSLKEILSRDAAGVKKLLASTPMGISRIPGEALLRNALIAAGNRGDGSLEPLIRRHCGGDSAEVSSAANWALDEIGSRR
jgi:epoxyqueuosine reductase